MTKKLGLMILVFMTLCSFSWAADGSPAGPPPNMPQDMQVGPTGQLVPQNLEVPDNLQLDRDIVFATINGNELKLDIAYPKERMERLPAVVYIHGGGFEMGDKPTDQTLLFAKNGFVGIAIQYRLSGVAKFPAAVHDCKTAIRWTRAHAETYGIDPERIGVIGESAGGYLVAMMGSSGGDAYLEGDGPYGEFPSEVQAVVDLFGPIDFLTMEDAPGGPVAKFLGKPAHEVPELAKTANPLTYVDGEDPPTLMIHGEEDNLVPVAQSELLCSALTGVGVRARVVRVANAGHGFSPASQGAVVSPGLDEIEALEIQWFREILGVGK